MSFYCGFVASNSRIETICLRSAIHCLRSSIICFRSSLSKPKRFLSKPSFLHVEACKASNPQDSFLVFRVPNQLFALRTPSAYSLSLQDRKHSLRYLYLVLVRIQKLAVTWTLKFVCGAWCTFCFITHLIRSIPFIVRALSFQSHAANGFSSSYEMLFMKGLLIFLRSCNFFLLINFYYEIIKKLLFLPFFSIITEAEAVRLTEARRWETRRLKQSDHVLPEICGGAGICFIHVLRTSWYKVLAIPRSRVRASALRTARRMNISYVSENGKPFRFGYEVSNGGGSRGQVVRWFEGWWSRAP